MEDISNYEREKGGTEARRGRKEEWGVIDKGIARRGGERERKGWDREDKQVGQGGYEMGEDKEEMMEGSEAVMGETREEEQEKKGRAGRERMKSGEHTGKGKIGLQNEGRGGDKGGEIGDIGVEGLINRERGMRMKKETNFHGEERKGEKGKESGGTTQSRVGRCPAGGKEDPMRRKEGGKEGIKRKWEEKEGEIEKGKEGEGKKRKIYLLEGEGKENRVEAEKISQSHLR